MAAYYNEIEPFAAEWMRNLIKKGLIADGEVDTRSIVDVRPSDLAGFTQCHFFAGIGGWSHALRLAGWPDDRPIWTGSCPCQPFSVAGRGLGEADPRHLWPHFHRLIAAVRPPVVMGEQVSGAAGYGWLDGVRSDLEGENYACRGVDIPACAVDAPHIRQRLYWVAMDMADASSGGWPQGVQQVSPGQAERAGGDRLHHRGAAGDMGDADHQRSQEHRRPDELHQGQEGREVAPRSALDASVDDLADSDSLGRPHERLDGVRRQSVHDADGRGERGDMADADGSDIQARCGDGLGAGPEGPRDGSVARCRDDNDARYMADAESFSQREPHDDERTVSRENARAGTGGGGERHSAWANAIWLTGADGKARRAEPSIPLLANGIPGRVGRLRAYGNAIVAPLAAEVIRAFMDVEAGELPPSSFPLQGQ